LLGGPICQVMGDEFGEGEKLPFRSYRGVVSLRRVGHGEIIANRRRRAALLRQRHAALHTRDRNWLKTADGAHDGDILAATRIPQTLFDRPLMVFANFNNHDAREQRFLLDEEMRKRIDPAKRYQARDLYALDPTRTLFEEPLLGSALLERGMPVKLDPYQISVVALDPVP
jgi:hypothetical protein